MKQELQDEMFEAMLRSAFQDHREEEELLTEEELRAMGVEPHSFSPAFEQKMKKLTKEMRRKERRNGQSKWFQYTAAVFAALIFGIKQLLDIDE